MSNVKIYVFLSLSVSFPYFCKYPYLQVNGQSLLGENHKDVVNILKELPINVRMVCCRAVPPVTEAALDETHMLEQVSQHKDLYPGGETDRPPFFLGVENSKKRFKTPEMAPLLLSIPSFINFVLSVLLFFNALMVVNDFRYLLV